MEESKVVSDATQENLGEVQEQQSKSEDKVAYTTYKKVLGEKKKMQDAFESLQGKLKEYETKELESQGKQGELIERLRKDKEESDRKLKELSAKTAWEKIESQIKMEAHKRGCVNPDKLVKLLDETDFASLEVDPNNYTINRQDLDGLMEKARKENNFIFKSNASVNDMTPSKVTRPTKPLSELSMDDLMKLAQSVN